MLPARQAIVDALATVAGLAPTPVTPDTPTAGAAWPVWAASQFTQGKLTRPITHSYDVNVVLPAGAVMDTVDAGDGLVEQVMRALRACGPVEPAEPVQIVLGPNQAAMPGIRTRVTVALC